MSRKRTTTSHPWHTLTGVISTTMVLVLLGLVVSIVLAAQRMADSVRRDLTVTLVLNHGIATQQAKQLQSRLEKEPYIHHIHYISAEEALKEQMESMGMDPSDLLEANPFDISMEVTLQPRWANTDSLLVIEKTLKEDPAISEVAYQKQLMDSLNRNIRKVSIGLLVIAALLVLVSLSLINSTVRLEVYNHRFRISSMKLVGARWSFILRPFMWRALWQGMCSGVIAMGLLFALHQTAVRQDPTILTYVTWQGMGFTTAVVMVTGVLLTMSSTLLSVTQYLKKRETDLY